MRVLIIEDDIELAKTLSDKLHAKEYQCDIAENLSDAKYYLDIRNYNLVLLSWEEEILRPFAAMAHTTIAINAGIGIITAKTPKPVATPLPPSKNKNAEKQCPTTASTAIVHNTPSPAPRYLAASSTSTPLIASKKSVIAPSFFASFGSFSLTTRSTLVAPIFPEPSFLISTPAIFLARIYPNGIPAIR